MLTIREALAMPVFAQARVAAGAAGLDRHIRWVHIVDIPDARYEWGRRGVFLLTAGLGLQGDPERQAALIAKLVEQEFAGLVLSAGYYFQQTPQVIVEVANAAGFPVIEIPRDVLFIDITEAIFEQIVNRQYALLQQSAQIHQQLTRLVLRGGNLTDLAATLAGLLKRSVAIEDPAFTVLATAQHGPVDEARRLSSARGRTSPEMAQHLLDAGIYSQLLKTMAPVRVPPMPDFQMTLGRLVVPIIVDREIYGHIWIIVDDDPLTDLDELTVEHGATVAALIMFKERAVSEAQEGLRGDFFEYLLHGPVDATTLGEQARQLDYRLDKAHQVLVIHGAPASGGNPKALGPALESWLRQRDSHALLVWREGNPVAVVESNGIELGQRLAAALVDDLSHPAQRLLVGVGGLCAPGPERAGSIRRSYEEAREAVQVSVALSRREGVICFEELGLLHWLYQLSPEQRAGNIYSERVLALVKHDSRHNTELVKTLETYLDQGRSLIATAEALHVHRNTLLHRLNRIKQLCALELRDPLERLNMYAAIKSYRLHGP